MSWFRRFILGEENIVMRYAAVEMAKAREREVIRYEPDNLASVVAQFEHETFDYRDVDQWDGLLHLKFHVELGFGGTYRPTPDNVQAAIEAELPRLLESVRLKLNV